MINSAVHQPSQTCSKRIVLQVDRHDSALANTGDVDYDVCQVPIQTGSPFRKLIQLLRP